MCLRGLCSRGVDLPLLRAGATLECKRPLGCDPKASRRMFTAWAPKVEGLWVPSVHADCNHNEIAALLMRSLGPTPVSAESARGPFLSVFRHIRGVCRRYGGKRWSYLETAESYTGSLRRRYIEAERSLREDGPLFARDWSLGAFLKAEKVNALAKFPKPRMIFPRSPRYNLCLASRLKPFEHWLWGNLKSWSRFGVPPTRVVAKGLNPTRRAGLVRRKMSQIPGCVVLEVDGKAFEAHVDVWQLVEEHSCYGAAFPGDRALLKLLSKQLRNFGVTKGGVKFSREGGRASGDYNTGMGNSVVMLSAVVGVLEVLGISMFDVLVDGDNALLFVRGVDYPRVDESFARVALEISGHEMVLERPVRLLEGIRFGQSAPVEVAGVWRMVRDWRKVLSQGTSNHAHLRELPFVHAYLRGVALCELSLARGLPILQRWCEVVLEATEGARELSFEQWYRDYQALGVVGWGSSVAEVVRDSTRESFSRAFGISPSDQRIVEDSLSWSGVLAPWAPTESPTLANWEFVDPGLCENYLA